MCLAGLRFRARSCCTPEYHSARDWQQVQTINDLEPAATLLRFPHLPPFLGI
jgi:hypothetical protein